MKVLILLAFLIGGSLSLMFGQNDRFVTIKSQLDEFAGEYEAMNNPVDLSVSNSSLKEFIRGIAIANGINVDVDPDVNKLITNNFSNAKVKDVFFYLCKRYDLTIDITGSIITFEKYVPEQIVQKYEPKPVDVTYNQTNGFISFDLKWDTLSRVAKTITENTGKNVVLAPKVKDTKVSVFIKNRPFDDAIDKLCLSNDLKVTKTSDNFYYIEPNDQPKQSNSNMSTGNLSQDNQKKAINGLNVQLLENGNVSVSAKGVSTQDVIEEVSRLLNESYFIYGDFNGKSNLFIENANYEDFLSYVLNSSEYSFKLDEEVYLIGNRNDETLRQTKIVELENRRVENVLEAVPAKLKEGIEIYEFTELNGLVLSGSAIDIRELEEFITLIDVVVPVVTIEVIIADVNDTKTLTTGIQAGLSTEGAPDESSGTVSPGIDVDVSTNVINDVVDGVNGLGLVNLGYVSPSFYLKIKALEEQGDIEIKSTPTVATLNGHETTMKIGDEQYYLEVNNQIVNNQLNPNVYQSQQWKSVTADLTITVTPYITKDGQVTLDIVVEQSTFTNKVAETAPPGQTKRRFESLIRVKDGEMVLLGGLDENSKTETASGLPLLSRIPILKWIFSSRTKAKTKKQLTIFIRPTISYE